MQITSSKRTLLYCFHNYTHYRYIALFLFIVQSISPCRKRTACGKVFAVVLRTIDAMLLAQAAVAIGLVLVALVQVLRCPKEYNRRGMDWSPRDVDIVVR